MDTETRIRSAAVTLFARQGYAATGIREIAKAAGVSNAAIYHFVANKEALLVDIMRQMQQGLNDSTETALRGVTRPEDRLALLISGLAGSHVVNPKTGLVSDGEIRALAPESPGHTEIVGLRDRYEALWRDTLRDGVDDGIFRIADQRLTRIALLSMCSSVSEWYRPTGPDDGPSISAGFVGIGLAAVRARRDGREISAADVPVVDFTTIPRVDWEP